VNVGFLAENLKGKESNIQKVDAEVNDVD